MLPALIPIAALLIADALLLVGHGLLLTLLPITATNTGFTDTQVALTGSAYFLGFVSGCLGTPYMLRRVGHIRSFAVLATIYSAIVLIFPWISVFIGWLLLRFLVGAAISGLYMIIESWLNERASSENRGTILSTYTMLNLLMITVGQQLINLDTVESSQLFGLAAIFFSIAIIPVSLTLSLAPAPVQTVKISLAKIWENSHIGLIGAVVSGLVTGAFWALAPIYAKSSGFDNFQLGLFMSATVMGGAFFQIPLGKLSDQFDRRIVLMYTAIAGAFISIIFVFVTSFGVNIGGWLAAALAFFWGGMCMTLYAICLAHINDNTLPTDFVEIGSGMLITLGVCSAIGAPLASLFMSLLDAKGFYVYMAICLILFSLIISIRRTSHALPNIPESNEAFRPVADMTTPLAYEMDPRNEELSVSESVPAEKKGVS